MYVVYSCLEMTRVLYPSLLSPAMESLSPVSQAEQVIAAASTNVSPTWLHLQVVSDGEISISEHLQCHKAVATFSLVWEQALC